jgi:uncharacterized membrane protein (UPF0127 family)
MHSSTRGATVCERCVVADGAVARARGLLGRSGLQPGEGLLLTGAGSIHTHFMRFAIDVVFLDRDHRVLELHGAVAPWRIVRSRGASAVLELRAGEARRRGMQIGDVLRLGPQDEARDDAA